MADLRQSYTQLERLAAEAALDVDRVLNDEIDLESPDDQPSSEDYDAVMDAEEAAMLEQMELDELRQDVGGPAAVPEYESDEYDDIFMDYIAEHPEVEMDFMHS
jgi:hypothetical protein